MMMTRSPRPRRKNTGFVLIVSLLFLLIITVITVMMMRNYGLQGRMAGGFREKGRSFEAAQAALQYAEWWLSQGNGSTGSTCSSVVTSAVVCSNALSNPTSVPWSAGVSYTPSGMTTGASGTATYNSIPMYYIQYVGVNSTTGSIVYQITAVGYGGNAQAVTVLQSTYAMSTSSGGITNVGQ